jgi:serine/threonine protein kinase
MVWLAQDMEESRYVAVKVGFTWLVESRPREISVMKLLREHPLSNHPGKNHVVELLEYFVHDGSNGSHACIVTDQLGGHVGMALSDFDSENPVPYQNGRKISIQALQALDYLHQQGVMHGDVHSRNLVFALTYNIDDHTGVDIETKNQRGNESNEPDEKYTHDDRISISEGGTANVSVILIELGASSSSANGPSNKYAYPIPYRAPEVPMDTGSVTDKADIWVLGGGIWRIVIFVGQLGPVPESLRTAWLDSECHLTSDGLLKNSFPEDERELPIAEEFINYKPKGLSRDETTAFAEFMGHYFQF